MEIKSPTIEIVALSKLKPWSKNPRIKHAVDSIVGSIEKFGYLTPMVVQAKTYRVLSGHGRLKALKRMKKVKEVPVVIADITDRNADLYSVADNKLSDRSMFDPKATADILKGLSKFELKLTGFDDSELKKFMGATGEIEEAEGIAKKLKRVEFYAGGEPNQTKIAMNDRTLVVVFSSESQLRFVKDACRQAQSGNDKTVGDIVYAAFKNRKTHR